MLPNLSALNTNSLAVSSVLVNKRATDGLVVYGNVERWIRLAQQQSPDGSDTKWPYPGGLFASEELLDFFDNTPYVMSLIEDAINTGALSDDASPNVYIKVDKLDVQANIPESNGLGLEITFENVRSFVKAIDPSKYVTTSTLVDPDKRPWLASVVSRVMPAAENLTSWLTDRTLDMLLGSEGSGVFNIVVKVSLDIVKKDGSKSIMLRLQGMESDTNNLLLTIVGFLGKFAFPIKILSRFNNESDNDSLLFRAK